MFGDPLGALAKTRLTDTLDYLRHQDIILLQELASQKAHVHAQLLLHTHTLWYTTHERYRRGKGVAIALHKRHSHCYHTHQIHNEHQLIHLQLKHLLPHDSILHVLCWYVPHSQSTQLHNIDLLARYTYMTEIVDRITATQPGSLVVIAGDLNAKVGTAASLSSSAVGAILQHNELCGKRKHLHISLNRRQHHPEADFSGQLLNDMCRATNLINMTGITCNDQPAAASYTSTSTSTSTCTSTSTSTSRKQKPSRIDHVLVSPSVLKHFAQHRVMSHLLGSDHLPLQLTLNLQPHTATSSSNQQQQQQQQPTLQQIVPSKDRATIQRYITTLTDPDTFQELRQMAASEQATAEMLNAAFTRAVISAAVAAGYKVHDASQPKSDPIKAYSRHKVWHDSACKELQQRFRALAHLPGQDTERRAIQQQYKRRVTQLVRKHRAATAIEQAKLWRKDRSGFWRWYRPNGTHSPFSAQAIAEAFSKKLNSYAAAPSQQPVQQSSQLARFDITSECPSTAEIHAAIMRMDSKAAGTDGVPTALLKPALPAQPEDDNTQMEAPASQQPPSSKEAISSIAEALHIIYRKISDTASVPEQWHTALLMPIYKGKGQLSDISNYRPLSVPSVACRLWGSIINQRLLDATKDILPDTMFGFRPGRRTADPLLILRHLIDMQRAGVGSKFGVAFMDLSAAYDSIDRGLLFRKLRHLGMSTHSISTLQSLYRSTKCMVKCDNGLAAAFSVGVGLRQGCPLSTTLFNLYIWDLHKHLVEKASGVGVQMHGISEDESMLVTDLEYADDAALCASTPRHLQKLIDEFVAYCDAHGLQVNPQKCEIVVFAKTSRAWAGSDWNIKGRPLPRSQKFKYLGVELHGTAGIKGCIPHRLSCMVAAQSAISRRLHELRVPREPGLMADMFETITGAAGSYGCEVWSTPWLASWHLRDCTLQRFQATVYKQALKVPRSTSNQLAFFEMGRYPLQVQWLQRTVSYWNKLVANKANSELLDFTLVASVHQGLVHDHNSWARELMQGLQLADPDTDWETHMMQLKAIGNPRGIARLAKQKFAAGILLFDMDPTDPECPHRKRSTYCKLMYHRDDSGLLRTPAYITAVMPLHRKQALASVRLGCAPTHTNTTHAVPYQQRTCMRCSGGVDNEHHMLFDCQSSGLVSVRNAYSDLFTGVRDTHELMAAAYNSELVHTLGSCMQAILSSMAG